MCNSWSSWRAAGEDAWHAASFRVMRGPSWHPERARPRTRRLAQANGLLLLQGSDRAARRRTAPCQTSETHILSWPWTVRREHGGRRRSALARSQKCKHRCTNIYIFEQNTVKLLSSPRDHVSSSFSPSVQCQRLYLVPSITSRLLLILAVCCSVSMQPRCSVHRDGCTVLIVRLSTHCCLTQQKRYK